MMSALGIFAGGFVIPGCDGPIPIVIPDDDQAVEQDVGDPSLSEETEYDPRWYDGVRAEDDRRGGMVAIVVDNAPEARPQTGLASLPLVMEVPVEGTRTRFVGIVPLQHDGVIGPVRSARPYFVGLADGYGVPLVHVGGSPAALDLLASRRHFDEQQSGVVFRDWKRRMPFNAFATLDALIIALDLRSWSTETNALWKWSDEPLSAKEKDGITIDIPFGVERAFVVRWDYDDARKSYVRFQGGREHRDVSGAVIEARNVAALQITPRVIDGVGRLSIPELDPRSSSENVAWKPAIVYQNGVEQQAEWRCRRCLGGVLTGDSVFPISIRSTVSQEVIPMAPGVTWIEFVPFSIGDL
jgi:hypothetical protein